MQRRKFLSSILSGAVGVLPVGVRGEAPEPSRREPEAAAPPAPVPDYWTPLLTLKLADGRDIGVHNIAACRTYSSLILGRPDDSTNEAVLDELREFCKRVFVVEDSIIIPPVTVRRQSGGENWNEYPPVFAAALLWSTGGARRDGMFSELSVGWFQSSLQPLIPDAVLAEIQKLDWTSLARDVWW